jgi:hypothetical protein
VEQGHTEKILTKTIPQPLITAAGSFFMMIERVQVIDGHQPRAPIRIAMSPDSS